MRHGRYPHLVGKRRLPALRSLVETLAAHGYYNAAFTENAFVGSAFGFAPGFDLYREGQ